MIEKQSKEEGEACISTVLFDDRQEVLYDRVPVDKVEPMNDRQYYVRGCTALLDALGGAIHHIAKVHKYAREEDRPEKTLFIITTDGMENASHKYSFHKVGIGADRAINYECDREGTALNYQVLSETVSAVRKSRSRVEMNQTISACCASIREDYKKRHKNRRA